VSCNLDSPAEEEIGTSSLAAIGECVRNVPVLRALDNEPCATDANCPCGSFCDPVEHICEFNCMVPPANQAESCAPGAQCDDTGQCVTPGATPVSDGPVLAVSPPVLEVAPAAGPPQQLSAQLSVYSNDPAAVAAAQVAVVRVVASDDIEVSCNATVFGRECQLTDWTFAWDGTRNFAARPFWARTTAGNTDSHGHVTLAVDSTETELVVPASSAAPSLLEGAYTGVATSSEFAEGVPVDVRVRGDFVVVRDPSRIIAPDGALLLDLLTSSSEVPTMRRMVWLRSPTGGATRTMVGEYWTFGAVSFNAATGAWTSWFALTLPGPEDGPTSDLWTLRLQRTANHTAECSAAADCGAGHVCPATLQVCVPSAVWTPPTGAVANQLEDARSLAWWNAIDDLLGTSDTTPAGSAFATSGADMIEALMCSKTNTEAAAGRIGVQQLKQSGQPSRSGDLACVEGTGAGTSNLVPGAVGLVTHADRNGTAVSSALLDTCLADLARAPTSSFAANFGVNVGQCVNLARFAPALRLLATGELGKHTRANDPRTRGLFVRLLQQWSQLHGFLASTGLSQREFDDAVATTPAEAREALIELLDVLDAGWAAILDKRVAPLVATAAGWSQTSTSTIDYREAKVPIVYWPFNGNSTPQRDLIRGLDLTQRRSSSDPKCQILTSRNSLDHGFDCPGFRGTLAAGSPSLFGNTNLTVSMYVHDLHIEFPDYHGGTLFQTESLAGVVTPIVGTGDHDRRFALSLVHPTAEGGTEWVAFGWTFGLTSTSIAIVRDTEEKVYTLYVWEAWTNPPNLYTFKQRYQKDVSGALAGTSQRRIQLLNGNVAADGSTMIGQFPNPRSFRGIVDDFAIFKGALSRREFQRFAAARDTVETGRHTWPAAMTLTDHGTQEIDTRVGVSLLDTQVAHLEVVARLAQHLTYESQAACEGDSAEARANLEAGIARAGQSLRQSYVIENLVRDDPTDEADQARGLLVVKRSQIARTLRRLRSCTNPYGMGDVEVPLYFGDVTGETAAFFAASDHLLALAEPRASAAASALDEVRGRWEQARQSQIQQLQSDNARAIRVDELEARFGDQLKRLCGIADQTAEQIVQQVVDGDFSIDTCFVKPTATCLSQAPNGPIMDADPTCYRGVIGAQLMDMRAAYHAQQAAYQAWQAAVGNADGAELQCVLKEMDLFGCTAVDRHELEGVVCPPDHQGTIELIDEFNSYMAEKEAEKAWLDAIVTTMQTAVAVTGAVATTGPGGGFLVAASGSLGLASDELGRSMEARKRGHEAVLQKRALADDIRACWTQADQFQRAIASAEEASKEAADRMQSAIINFQNAVSEAREAVLEAPIVIEREQTRPSIPIAFHYWLPEAISSYRFLVDSARRYTYVALRATEYDTQEQYTTPQQGKPSRAAVLGAWRPDALLEQLSLMRDATNDRRTGDGRPAEDHLVLNVATDIFGLANPADLPQHLEANARAVYSRNGEYLGQGVRFTFLPTTAAETPTWRCAERLWLANVAATGFSGPLHVKLLKRTVFGSRSCDDDTFQVATLRPEANLLIGAGDPQTYTEQLAHVPADIDVVSLDLPGNVDGFHNQDDFDDGASGELAGQGLFGSYILLFTAPSLEDGLDLTSLGELWLRFDFVSIDNLPPTDLRRTGAVELEESNEPIFVAE
jgi:hypothetical protein